MFELFLVVCFANAAPLHLSIRKKKVTFKSPLSPEISKSQSKLSKFFSSRSLKADSLDGCVCPSNLIIDLFLGSITVFSKSGSVMYHD